MAKSKDAENALTNLNNVCLFNWNTEGKMRVEYSGLLDLSLPPESLDGKGSLFSFYSLFFENLTRVLAARKWQSESQADPHPLKLSRSNTFQIDVESERKSQMKTLKKQFIYNPLGYFRRSKTFDFDEIGFAPKVKQEIERVLDEKLDLSEEKTDTDIVSLRDLDSQNTISRSLLPGSTMKELSTKTFLCLPLKKPQNLDFLLEYFKEFKILIPDKSRLPVRKISIGINTSKEPSPINGCNFLSAQLKPNFLQQVLGLKETMLRQNGSPFPSFFPANSQSLLPLTPQLPLSYCPPGNNFASPLYDKPFMSIHDQEYHFNSLTGNNVSRVLYVRSLDNPFINVEMIYNLFSNFGNITQILFLKSKECALVEYENAEYANICKDALNNLRFFTNSLKVFLIAGN